MNRDQLVDAWLREEQVAHVHGWDFSHINERYDEERDLPWSYEEVLRSYLTPEARLLDVDTGGAEFLLSLGHPHRRTAATEGYPPNVRLCDERLLPLGVDFKEADAAVSLPFTSGSFDVVANRHGDVNEGEVARVLAPGGAFLSDVFNAARVLSTLVSREERTVAGERVSIHRSYDPGSRRVEKEITMGTGPAARTFRERVRVYLRDELEALHREAHFGVTAAFGDFDGTPYDPRRSPRLILLALTGGAR